MTIDEQLALIREEIGRLHKQTGSRGIPTVLTMERAAFEISRSQTSLRQMIKRRELMTVVIGKTRMVPASEIRRISTPVDAPRLEQRKTPSGLQDPEALKRRRR